MTVDQLIKALKAYQGDGVLDVDHVIAVIPEPHAFGQAFAVTLERPIIGLAVNEDGDLRLVVDAGSDAASLAALGQAEPMEPDGDGD